MRILFVGETASIHTARWINQFKDTGWDVHLCQSVAPTWRGVCADLWFGTVHVPYVPWPVQIPSGVGVELAVPQMSSRWMLGLLQKHQRWKLTRVWKRFYMPPSPNQAVHARYLAGLIRRLKPDIIHSLGLNVNMQNQCSVVLEARRLLKGKLGAPWVYSSWGTDLDYYAQLSAERRTEVESVLRTCDYYVAECQRDAHLAREMGLQGEFAGFFPAFGGVMWEDFGRLRQPGPVAARRKIMLKGRDKDGPDGDPIGRAMTAIKAFALDPGALAGYQIVISQAVPVVRSEATTLSAGMGLDIQALPFLSYEDVLRQMGSSRLFVALTVSDGLPSTLVEAMALGAFPIHSDLESIREWITDGENGLLVPPENPEAVSAALRQALADDQLVERAGEINARLVEERLSDTVVRPRAVELYEHIIREWPRKADIAG